MNLQEASAQARERLKHLGERQTPARVSILSLLIAAPAALSHQDIADSLMDGQVQFDRVTLYRVLDWLVAHDLAHRVASEDRVWRFSASQHEHKLHPHFQCTKCNKVTCLDSVKVEISPLPAGYTLSSAETTLQGVCPNC